MVTDIHKNKDKKIIEKLVADGMTGNKSQNGMNWFEFYERTRSSNIRHANRLVKSNQNLLKNICKDLKTRTTGPLDSLKRFMKFKFEKFEPNLYQSSSIKVVSLIIFDNFYPAFQTLIALSVFKIL